MVKRKTGTVITTIAILWEDKDEFRKFAKFLKKTKRGDMYESDTVLFKRILKSYKEVIKPEHESPNNTYPRKPISQEHVQQG